MQYRKVGIDTESNTFKNQKSEYKKLHNQEPVMETEYKTLIFYII